MVATATVNYHVHSPEEQAFQIDAGGIEGNLISPVLVSTPISLRNVRNRADAIAFERDCVSFLQSPSAVRDFEQPDGWRDVYNREITELLKKEIGAREVIIFDHTLRVDDPHATRKPARNVHSDYSPEGAHQRLRDLVGEDNAVAWEAGHFGFINLWRPVGAPINTAPLGFVRPRSVPQDDWITIKLIYPDRLGSIMGLAANDAHEWVYMSKMTPDEVVLFNIYDNRGRPSIAHSAIDMVEDPTIDTVRRSIESRTLVRY